MDIKAIKELATQYSSDELERFAEELENSGTSSLKIKEDPGELMSDLLQAKEVRLLLDQGKTMQEALREFSKRVREVLK